MHAENDYIRVLIITSTRECIVETIIVLSVNGSTTVLLYYSSVFSVGVSLCQHAVATRMRELKNPQFPFSPWISLMPPMMLIFGIGNNVSGRREREDAQERSSFQLGGAFGIMPLLKLNQLVIALALAQNITNKLCDFLP